MKRVTQNILVKEIEKENRHIDERRAQAKRRLWDSLKKRKDAWYAILRAASRYGITKEVIQDFNYNGVMIRVQKDPYDDEVDIYWCDDQNNLEKNLLFAFWIDEQFFGLYKKIEWTKFQIPDTLAWNIDSECDLMFHVAGWLDAFLDKALDAYVEENKEEQSDAEESGNNR